MVETSRPPNHAQKQRHVGGRRARQVGGGPGSLTARPRKMVVGRQTFPFGFRPIFRGELLNFILFKSLMEGR